MKLFSPTLLRRSFVIGLLAGAIGLGLAFAGLGIAGFFVAAAITSPAVLWIVGTEDRPGSRTGV